MGPERLEMFVGYTGSSRRDIFLYWLVDRISFEERKSHGGDHEDQAFKRKKLSVMEIQHEACFDGGWLVRFYSRWARSTPTVCRRICEKCLQITFRQGLFIDHF